MTDDELNKQARERALTQAIANRQKKSNEKRKRKPGKLHKQGSHWYELEAYHDPKLIDATPVQDGGFMMGVLEDMVVVEVAEDTAAERINQIGVKLSSMGIKALVVRRGVRFLRLKACSPEQEQSLNALLAQRTEKANAESAETPAADSGRDDSSG